MKLQKQKTRKVKNKDYFRWTVVIPPSQIDELTWQEGAELEATIRDDELVIRKRKKK